MRTLYSDTPVLLPDRPFGVNAQPPRRITPQFPYISESDLPYETMGQAWERMLAMGAQWVRIGHHGDRTSWDNVEVDRGVLRLDPDVEAAVARAVNGGARVQVTLAYGNAMYTGPGWKPHRQIPNIWQGAAGIYYGPDTQDAVDAYVNYCAYMARRLGGWVHDWEIWNEEDLIDSDGLYNPWGPETDPVAYTRMLRAAAVRIREIDPAASISFGGTAGLGYTFLEACLQEGAGEAIDVVSYHPYRPPSVHGCNGTPEEAMGPLYTGPRYGAINYMEEVAALQALCDRYKPGIRLWCNELGWSVPPQAAAKGLIPKLFHGPVDETTQAIYLLRAYLVNLAIGIPTAWWWLLGAPRLAGYGVPTTPDEGLLRPDLSERPAFAALGRLIALLGTACQALPLGAVGTVADAPDLLYAFVFRAASGEMLLALWLAAIPSAEARSSTIVLELSTALAGPLRSINLLDGREHDLELRGGEGRARLILAISVVPIVVRLPPTT